MLRINPAFNHECYRALGAVFIPGPPAQIVGVGEVIESKIADFKLLVVQNGFFAFIGKGHFLARGREKVELFAKRPLVETNIVHFS